MKKVNTLNLHMLKDEWFVLENGDMDHSLFTSLVNAIEKIFDREYTKGASDFVKKVDKNDKFALLIKEIKVPNIIKILVQNPNTEIEIKLTVIDAQKNEVSRTIRKPFDAQKVTELLSYYNNTNKR